MSTLWLWDPLGSRFPLKGVRTEFGGSFSSRGQDAREGCWYPPALPPRGYLTAGQCRFWSSGRAKQMGMGGNLLRDTKCTVPHPMAHRLDLGILIFLLSAGKNSPTNCSAP